MFPINFYDNKRTERFPSHIFNAFLANCLNKQKLSSKVAWDKFFKVAIIDHHSGTKGKIDETGFLNSIGPLLSADRRVYKSDRIDYGYCFFPLTSTIINPKPRFSYYGDVLFKIISKYDSEIDKMIVDFYLNEVDKSPISIEMNDKFSLQLNDDVHAVVHDEINFKENEVFNDLMIEYSKILRNIIENDKLFYVQKIKYIGNLLSFFLGMINQLHAVITSENKNSFIKPFFYAGLPPGSSSESSLMLSIKSFSFISNSAVKELINQKKIKEPPHVARDIFGRNSASQGYNSGFMNNKGRRRFYLETQLLTALIAGTVKKPTFFEDWSDYLFNNLGISLGGGLKTKIEQVENSKIQTQSLSGVSDTLNKNSELMKDRLVKLRLGSSYSDLGVEINPI